MDIVNGTGSLDSEETLQEIEREEGGRSWWHRL
jgi:hypothetical protein